MYLCMVLGPKAGVLPSFVAKPVGNSYCTETSVQPATVEVREYSIRVGHSMSNQRKIFLDYLGFG